VVWEKQPRTNFFGGGFPTRLENERKFGETGLGGVQNLKLKGVLKRVFPPGMTRKQVQKRKTTKNKWEKCPTKKGKGVAVIKEKKEPPKTGQFQKKTKWGGKNSKGDPEKKKKKKRGKKLTNPRYQGKFPNREAEIKTTKKKGPTKKERKKNPFPSLCTSGDKKTKKGSPRQRRGGSGKPPTKSSTPTWTQPMRGETKGPPQWKKKGKKKMRVWRLSTKGKKKSKPPRFFAKQGWERFGKFKETKKRGGVCLKRTTGSPPDKFFFHHGAHKEKKQKKSVGEKKRGGKKPKAPTRGGGGGCFQPRDTWPDGGGLKKQKKEKGKPGCPAPQSLFVKARKGCLQGTVKKKKKKKGQKKFTGKKAKKTGYRQSWDPRGCTRSFGSGVGGPTKSSRKTLRGGGKERKVLGAKKRC